MVSFFKWGCLIPRSLLVQGWISVCSLVVCIFLFCLHEVGCLPGLGKESESVLGVRWAAGVAASFSPHHGEHPKGAVSTFTEAVHSLRDPTWSGEGREGEYSANGSNGSFHISSELPQCRRLLAVCRECRRATSRDDNSGKAPTRTRCLSGLAHVHALP